jgi:hypothetical protein
MEITPLRSVSGLTMAVSDIRLIPAQIVVTAVAVEVVILILVRLFFQVKMQQAAVHPLQLHRPHQQCALSQPINMSSVSVHLSYISPGSPYLPQMFRSSVKQ